MRERENFSPIVILGETVFFGIHREDVPSQKEKWKEEEAVKVLLMMSAYGLKMEGVQKV